MRQKSTRAKEPAEKTVRDIRRRTRKQYLAEERIRIMLEGLRGEDSIAALCRREGIAESLYYSWSKEFLEAGKKRLAGDTARQTNTGEVRELRREMRDMKELAADIVVFDEAAVKPRLPTVEYDQPGDVRRLVQKAEGVCATIVNGAVTLEDGESTGAIPGSVIRGRLAA